MKFRLRGWDGALYFYFCIVCVKNYSVLHLLLFALFIPLSVFQASARRDCAAGRRGWREERPGLFYWIYTLSQVSRSL